MPFRDHQNLTGPMALPNGFDLNPDAPEVEGSVLGSAFRQDNPIGSLFNQYRYDTEEPFDPDYRIWDDIQGTIYEQYSDRFVESRNAKQTAEMKATIDSELSDRAVLDAAGGWGMLASMGAGVLSPTSLLPGGVLVQGAKGGLSIGKTALSVAGTTGAAVALDEIALHGTQQARTVEESVFAIGGSVILGGFMGSAAGHLSKSAHTRAARAAEQLPAAVAEFDETLRSVGAAENASDFTLRREQLFSLINRTPVLKGLVRSDPILRAQLSDNVAVRSALVDLVETPLQYRANEEGNVVGRFDSSAETAIKARRNTELTGALSHLNKYYAEYVHDGAVGLVGRVTAPLTGRWGHLAGLDRKMSNGDFMQEVGKSLMSSDSHPIPQVEKAAQMIRKTIFDNIKDDAIDVGLMDAELKLKYGDSYFTRSYNLEKIEAHLRDGSENDITVLLESEFKRKRTEAEIRLVEDRTLDKLEASRFQAREQARTAQSALNKAVKKANDKKERAEQAVGREKAVGRVTGALRRNFEKRTSKLQEQVFDGEELEAFKDILADARGIKRIEPRDMLSAIRDLGGIRDDGSGELKAALDTSLHTIKRNDGMFPDDMRGAMEELGYIPEGGTTNDFFAAIRENATGKKIYSAFDHLELQRFEAAQEFADTMSDLGVDISRPVDEIVKDLPGVARNQSAQRAKSKEAGRSGRKAGGKEQSAENRLNKAIERLEAAKSRIREIDEEIAPKVRDEITQAQQELKELIPQIKEAKAARAADEYYADLDDLAITSAVDDTVKSLLGLKPGEHSYRAALSKPTRARALDVHDHLLWPWLELDAGKVLSQYFNGMVPDIEITRRFGDLDLTEAKQKILDETDRLYRKAKSPKERAKHREEASIRIKELQNMADRIRGTYGVPDNPKDVWMRGLRTSRTLSYMGYLGGMTLSAMPDIAGVLGRNGLEAAFGSLEGVTNPKRFGLAIKDQAELGAAAEWWLNSRSMALAEVFDQYGKNTKFERGLDAAASGFGVATGMVPWNLAWKSIGGAFSASKMSKAAVAVANGKASKGDLLKLSENGIAPWMAERIAKQIDQYADRDGLLWLPKAADWDDVEAFEAFRNAMNREMDLMVVTPGQDKPIAWSSETGKFFSQFKSFAISAHHRILLSGLQRRDGAVLSQVLLGVTLGMLVSKVKSSMGGYEKKTGVALWEDAIDRSGLTGWLLEAHGLANGFAGGRLSLSGEEVSRFGSRSEFQGLLGPSIDMGAGVYEGISAMSRGEMSSRDARKILRPIPGNNLPYLMGLTKRVSEEMSELNKD